MNKRLAALLAVAIPVTGLAYLAKGSLPSGKASLSRRVTLHDQTLTHFVQSAPHDPSQAEFDMLLDLPDGAPPPAGYTIADHQRCTVIAPGILDVETGDPLITISIMDAIADIDRVEVIVDGQVVHTATRTGGSGTFIDRGSYTYATLSTFVPPVLQSGTEGRSEVTWYDSRNNCTGRRALGD